MRANSLQYYDEPEAAITQAELIFTPRNRYVSILFVPDVLIAGISWMAGGIPILTDLSFLILTTLCVVLLVEEFAIFSRRFGLGGITLYGGILMWFCWDYMTTWFFLNFNTVSLGYGPLVIAKSAFLHHIFILFGVMGLQLPPWKRLERWSGSIPEPGSHQLYVLIILGSFFIGMIPFLFFTVESPPMAIWHSIVGGRASGAGFTIGRTGNVNSSWGAYLAQLMQVGQTGAILAIFYVLVLRPGFLMSAVCVAIWLLQAALGFGGGTRGETAFMIMPALFLVFLKHQSQAAEMFKKFSVKAYVAAALVGFSILVIVQIQITYRNSGFSNVQLSEVSTGLQGNSMFSEGLPGMAIIPERSNFFSNSIPGQGAILAMPDYLWRFAYGPIPRALWPNKPIDPLWKWYNAVVTGRSEDEYEGTTISTGLIGDWYFRFGIAGLVEGGLLFGWSFMMAERLLQNSQGRVLQMILSIGLLVYLFRSFRGPSFINLYPLLIGLGGLILLVRMTGGSRQVTLEHN